VYSVLTVRVDISKTQNKAISTGLGLFIVQIWIFFNNHNYFPI